MKKVESLFFYLGSAMLISEFIKQLLLTFMVGDGRYDWWYFPFQLCSVPMYLLPLYRHLKSTLARRVLLVFFMTYSLLGGVAVFFDTSGMHYPLAILTIHSYLWHLLLIAVGIISGVMLLRNTRLSIRLFFYASLLYGVCCLAATFLNWIISFFGSINMFYINPVFRMNQVFFRRITDQFGNSAGIASYLAGTVLGASVLYLLWYLIQRLCPMIFASWSET
ncbi:MAG: YwaF family protein [Coprococcus sp.]|nr:YwaF family protein [Coprococcus sp.]